MMFVVFGEDDHNRARKKVMGLANALEMAYLDPSRSDVVVDAASQMCSTLRGSDVSLTIGEKVRVLKSVTRAKVKAFIGGTTDNYRTYRSLDAISGDLLDLL